MAPAARLYRAAGCKLGRAERVCALPFWEWPARLQDSGLGPGCPGSLRGSWIRPHCPTLGPRAPVTSSGQVAAV